ncbi:MAG: magnesium transporter CorA family protein [Planctomycetota bacterium]|nr:magnesium transporter CorA family protein [Planctomycetota bacterium]
MLKRMNICDGKVCEVDSPACCVHVYVAPDEGERKFLAGELKLDEHTLNSALDPDELARLEFEPEHTALIIKRPKNYCSEDNFLFKVASIGLFIFKDRLVVVVADEAPLFEGREFASVKSILDIVLRVIHRSIFHFEGHLRVISALSDELEGEINKAMENKHLLNLFTLEKSLVYYLTAITTNGRVIDKLKANAVRLGLTPEQMEFVDDILIENSQCYELAQIYSQVLSSLMDARVSVVSNNLNQLMKTLTLVMIAIMLPTLVISAFSMNVRLPLEQEIGIVSFWIIMGLAAASTATVWLVWRFRKW